MRTGLANLPLHTGHCPKWLFPRMKKLGGAISEVIVNEQGHEEFLRRLSDPFWFQAFGCVLGFDWHSSGLTTTVLGAIKEAELNKIGIAICGGKGGASRKTPDEIVSLAGKFSLSDSIASKLVNSSKMTAKVDSALIQDGYQLYHHVFIFTEKSQWAVIQQGLNNENRYARRYHWLSDNVKSFVEEPHNAICCDSRESRVLDMTSRISDETRKISVDLVKDNSFVVEGQKTLNSFFGNHKTFSMPAHHEVKNLGKQVIGTLKRAYEIQPQNYEELIAIKGVGPKTLRALALISQIVYGAEPSWKDPVKFSFAHGGKDGHPYMINQDHYDKSIEIMRNAIENAKIGDKEKLFAIKRLNEFL